LPAIYGKIDPEEVGKWVIIYPNLFGKMFLIYKGGPDEKIHNRPFHFPHFSLSLGRLTAPRGRWE
jgi:hypothetical protein